MSLNKEKINNFYKIVSFTSSRLYVIPLSVATTIVNKIEYTQLNKIELTKEKELILKLNANRLGDIRTFSIKDVRKIFNDKQE